MLQTWIAYQNFEAPSVCIPKLLKVIVGLHSCGTVKPISGKLSHEADSIILLPTHAEEMKTPMRKAPMVGTRTVSTILGLPELSKYIMSVHVDSLYCSSGISQRFLRNQESTVRK